MIKRDGLIFIDRWCAKNVRKVIDCAACLHYEECEAAGKSLSQTAQDHARVCEKSGYNFSEDLAKALGIKLEDDENVG